MGKLKSNFERILIQKMSGRAIPAAVNWAALLKQTAPADRKLMAAFKLKSDTIAANFAKAAGFKREIDWAHYEANLSKSGFVADFKAQYEATEIPVPSDNGMEAQLEAKAAADEVAVADYIKKVDGQIADASVTLNNIKALPPFEQMTQADILYFFPQLCRNQESIFNSENCRHITLWVPELAIFVWSMVSSGSASNKLMKMLLNFTQHTDWMKVNTQVVNIQLSSVLSHQQNSMNHSHLLIHSSNGNKSLTIQSSMPM